jgi:N-acyl homoserine lactone hydrolase
MSLELRGFPLRLYLFQLGTTTMPTANGSIKMSAGCYLVQTSTGNTILIDSGLPPDYTPPFGAPASGNHKNLLEQLAQLDLQPDDIDAVVCTHFDIDHVGYHPSFPNAEFIVQREHYELASDGHPRFVDSRPYWDDPSLRYRLVDGDADVLPGLSLVKTPGHAPAHQSVLVRLPRTGNVLLAIDAVMMGRLFMPDRPAWPMDDDEADLRASTQKLLDLVDREGVSLVVFGHDGEQWESLKTAPRYYD